MTEIVQTRRRAGATSTSHFGAEPGPPAGAVERLSVPSRRLANAARALRGAAETPREAPDLVLALAELAQALADVAAGAELAAYAVIERDRPAGAPATHVSPTRTARALSWRLHALASALRAASDVCAVTRSASREHSRARTSSTRDRSR